MNIERPFYLRPGLTMYRLAQSPFGTQWNTDVNLESVTIWILNLVIWLNPDFHKYSPIAQDVLLDFERLISTNTFSLCFFILAICRYSSDMISSDSCRNTVFCNLCICYVCIFDTLAFDALCRFPSGPKYSTQILTVTVVSALTSSKSSGALP